MIEIPKGKLRYAAVSKFKVILKSFTRNTSPHACYTSLGPGPNLLLSSPVFVYINFCFLNFYSYRQTQGKCKQKLQIFFIHTFTFFKFSYFPYILDKSEKEILVFIQI